MTLRHRPENVGRVSGGRDRHVIGNTNNNSNSATTCSSSVRVGVRPIDDNTEVESEYEEMTETDGEIRRVVKAPRLQGSPFYRSGSLGAVGSGVGDDCRGGGRDGKLLPDLEAERPLSQRLQTFRVRCLWTMILVFSFVLILGAGHFYCSCLVLLLTMAVYQEVISLRQNDEKENRLPLFFFLRWYWFAVTILATGSVWLFPLILKLLGRRHYIDLMMGHHAIVTYIGAFVGLMLFILSLRKFSLRYQFSKFALLLLTCILVVGQSMVQIANIYNGLIWFVLSCSCVIVNDIFAYIVGVFFGRTRLIKLSPKKTVEGYLGASVFTVLWAFIISTQFSSFPVFYCPQDHISFRPYAMWTQTACQVPLTFTARQYEMPEVIARVTGMKTFTAMPMQFHGLAIGVFAAFFAPFGGFFASGLKRALRIKDFGQTIPGHGGFTDRFDCQIIMGMFTYIYIRTFVLRRFGVPTIASLLKSIRRLDAEDQLRLLTELQMLVDR